MLTCNISGLRSEFSRGAAAKRVGEAHLAELAIFRASILSRNLALTTKMAQAVAPGGLDPCASEPGADFESSVKKGWAMPMAMLNAALTGHMTQGDGNKDPPTFAEPPHPLPPTKCARHSRNCPCQNLQPTQASLLCIGRIGTVSSSQHVNWRQQRPILHCNYISFRPRP